MIDVKKEMKPITEVLVVCDFRKVFQNELPGLPPERQVEFRIHLIPGMTPIAKAPCCLVPT